MTGDEHGKHAETRRDEPDAVRRTLSASLECFAQKGFHGTSVREIAQLAGVSVAALYYYFPSKLAILAALMEKTANDHIAEVQRVLAESPNEPAARLGVLVYIHVHRHTSYRAESLVGNSELRSLDEFHRRSYVKLRDEIQRMFDQVILDGVAEGVFHCAFPLETSRAISTMCTAVAHWYQSTGTLTPMELADRYVVIALAMLRYDSELVDRVRLATIHSAEQLRAR